MIAVDLIHCNLTPISINFQANSYRLLMYTGNTSTIDSKIAASQRGRCFKHLKTIRSESHWFWSWLLQKMFLNPNEWNETQV